MPDIVDFDASPPYHQRTMPTPGSPHAVRLGCSCEQAANGFGTGRVGRPGFYGIHNGCWLHSWETPERECPFKIEAPDRHDA